MSKDEVNRTKDKGRDKGAVARAAVFCALSFFLCTSRAGASDVERLSGWEARAYPLILPAEHEMRWYRIPWMLDLEEAVKVAKKEKRPLLVWVAGHEPLERC